MGSGGRIAVTPVRTGPCPTTSRPSPSMSVVWPTRTPGTSVMAFTGPVGTWPMAKPRSRKRARMADSSPYGVSGTTGGVLSGGGSLPSLLPLPLPSPLVGPRAASASRASRRFSRIRFRPPARISPMSER